MKELRELTSDEFEILAIYLTLEYMGYEHPSEVQEEGDESIGRLSAEIKWEKERLNKSFLRAYDNDRGTYIVFVCIHDESEVEMAGEPSTVTRQDKFVDEFFISKDGKIENCAQWDII